MSEIIGCYARCARGRPRARARCSGDSAARPARRFIASKRGKVRRGEGSAHGAHVYKVDFNGGLVTIMRQRNGGRRSLPR
jgi:hypothetical protein